MNRLSFFPCCSPQEQTGAHMSENMFTVADIKRELGESSDLVIGTIPLDDGTELQFAFLETLVNPDRLYDMLEAIYRHYKDQQVTGVELEIHTDEQQPQPISQRGQQFERAVLRGSIAASTPKDMEDALLSLLAGETLLHYPPTGKWFVMRTCGAVRRSVEKPESESVIRGPQEGFNESLEDMLALIRKRMRLPSLRIEELVVGDKSKTRIALVYDQQAADPEFTRHMRETLAHIKIDVVLDSNYIEEFLQENKFSMFPTVLSTQRPDRAVAALMEGRVVIAVDGTPFALIAPATFLHFFESPEDYNHRVDIGLLRILRLVSFMISVLLPAFFIAVTNFHQEMIPTTLLIDLAAQREGVPLPALGEALIMISTFEFLQEASVRLPRAIGTSVSIVGALVLGQSAVEAGIVSPVMVIIVAVTAICALTMPNYEMNYTIRWLRFGFMLLASTFGLYGVFVGFITLLLHINHLHSFGQPYLFPVAPWSTRAQQDGVVRAPLWGTNDADASTTDAATASHVESSPSMSENKG
ncbi:spore germination protein [Paenibacillus sp. 481]|uniref:spore germination protein n=1 Tax=Paenibacillus sp. 481 TaxID=2835869 RepID=UPI001E47324E|nr:spore germination protein [Paenibacillus sp. 481]UHA75603.1 spore germination protein [Paenibacillus sp. 481]